MHFKVRKTGLVVKLFIFNVSSGYIDFSSVSVLNLKLYDCDCRV